MFIGWEWHILALIRKAPVCGQTWPEWGVTPHWSRLIYTLRHDPHLHPQLSFHSLHSVNPKGRLVSVSNIWHWEFKKSKNNSSIIRAKYTTIFKRKCTYLCTMLNRSAKALCMVVIALLCCSEHLSVLLCSCYCTVGCCDCLQSKSPSLSLYNALIWL